MGMAIDKTRGKNEWLFDFDEIKIITNYQFESNYIVMIYDAQSHNIEWSVNSFIDFYTNLMETNK